MLLGLAFIVYGIRAERASQRTTQPGGLGNAGATRTTHVPASS